MEKGDRSHRRADRGIIIIFIITIIVDDKGLPRERKEFARDFIEK